MAEKFQTSLHVDKKIVSLLSKGTEVHLSRTPA